MDGRDRAEIDFRWAHQVTKETRRWGGGKHAGSY